MILNDLSLADVFFYNFLCDFRADFTVGNFGEIRLP